MIKISLLTIITSLLFIINGHTQSLKLRLENGNAINFNSYNDKLFNSYSLGPMSTSEISVKTLPEGSLLDIPFHLSILLEYDIKRRNHFSIGYSKHDYYVASNIVKYNIGFKANDSLLLVVQEGTIIESENALNKIFFEYSRDFGTGIFRFSPLIGFAYAWMPVAPEFNKVYTTYRITFEPDRLYSCPKGVIEEQEIFLNRSTWMGTIGFNVRIHSKKRELFAIKFYYQQGFRPFEKFQAYAERNNKIFFSTIDYAYGSALYLKVSVPIPLYNFTEHKFFK